MEEALKMAVLKRMELIIGMGFGTISNDNRHNVYMQMVENAGTEN